MPVCGQKQKCACGHTESVLAAIRYFAVRYALLYMLYDPAAKVVLDMDVGSMSRACQFCAKPALPCLFIRAGVPMAANSLSGLVGPWLVADQEQTVYPS